MARARWNETTVRDSALSSLAAYYNAREDVGKVANQADAGLVACRMKAGGVLCAVVEAKTFDNRYAVRASDGGIPLLAAAFAGAGLTAWATWLATGRGIVTAILFVAAFTVLRYALARSAWFVKQSIVATIAKSPAHERWVALPVDLLDTPYAATVRSECRARGIGVLRIGRSRSSTILDLPRRTPSTDDVLARYRCAARVMERLA